MEGLLEKIRMGELPDHARLAVVQGIMPLEPEELVSAVYYLCSQDTALLEPARETVDGLPEGILKQYFENRDIDSEIIDFFLTSFKVPAAVRGAMILNPKTSAYALEDIAEVLDAQLLDLVVNNQVKIQENPEIIQALRRNPGLSINHKQKLDEYERLLVADLVSPAEELEHLDPKEVEAQAIAEAREFVAVFGKERESQSKDKKAEKVDRADRTEGDADTPIEERAAASGDKTSILEQLANMSIPQKIQAAVKGDREVRSILIRDANKLVCTAVIKSPRISDSEVEFYSNLRNVQTDVLRLIAMNRDWVKNYKIIHNLVKNPRTPIAFSMKFLPRLHKRDQRHLIRDKGIPEALRTMARRLSRGQGK